jgi:hypothetical protein
LTDRRVRLAGERGGRGRRRLAAAAGGGGAHDGVEPAGLHARVRGVLAVQPRQGELQVLRRGAGALPHGVPMHVQGQVLPRAIQLAHHTRPVRDETSFMFSVSSAVLCTPCYRGSKTACLGAEIMLGPALFVNDG